MADLLGGIHGVPVVEHPPGRLLVGEPVPLDQVHGIGPGGGEVLGEPGLRRGEVGVDGDRLRVGSDFLDVGLVVHAVVGVVPAVVGRDVPTVVVGERAVGHRVPDEVAVVLVLARVREVVHQDVVVLEVHVAVLAPVPVGLEQ
ncbi:hypothetical protein [Actinophytocola xanthii]|uniref:hypothetical protein n=1 Tax=Actinophytocola xanthii TaxID=1912961 RepID=UPI001178C500|nr:hypothetical protein [Actinophytocola xanthii]